MTTEIENVECLCAFVESMGQGVAQQISAFITSVISLLEVAKAEILLVSNLENLEDMGRKIASEQALAALSGPIGQVEATFNIVNSYTAPFADCDPVSAFSTAVKTAKNEVLGALDDLTYEIELWGAAIEARTNKVDQLDRTIAVLEQIQAGIEECGDI